MKTTPPMLCSNSSECQNSSCSLVGSIETEIFFTQDRELVSILVDLENIDNNSKANAIRKTRFSGYFCSNTMFNLNRKVLMDNEIKVLEKGLDYTPIQSKINEPKLLNDFEEFCRRMRLKWYFPMSLHLNLVRHLYLHLSLRGNHLKVILLLKYF